MFRMPSRLSRLIMAVAITILALGSLATAAERQRPVDSLRIGPIVWSVLAAPIHPVRGTDGLIHLVYELPLTNASHFDVRITGVEVLDARTERVSGVNRVVSADGRDVTGKVRRFSLPQQTQDAVDYGDRLSPGEGGVVYFDVSYPAPKDVPAALRHRIVAQVRLPDRDPQVFTVIDEGTGVDPAEPLAIAAPLRGMGWVVANGSGPIISPHRYTVQPTNGRLRPPEHFAIDFIRLDTQGRASAGDRANVHNWFDYGAEVLSAARGRVVEVRDDLPDQIPGQPKAPLSPDQYAGNHVIVAIGAGRFALYAHLAPGSVVARKGEEVRPGQVLGRLGSSGNSDAPHLHFQIMDSASVLNTNGLPFVFDRLTYQGRFMGTLDSVGDTLFSGEAPAIDAHGAGSRTLQMPLTLDLIGLR